MLLRSLLIALMALFPAIPLGHAAFARLIEGTQSVCPPSCECCPLCCLSGHCPCAENRDERPAPMHPAPAPERQNNVRVDLSTPPSHPITGDLFGQVSRASIGAIRSEPRPRYTARTQAVLSVWRT